MAEREREEREREREREALENTGIHQSVQSSHMLRPKDTLQHSKAKMKSKIVKCN
jgi:hypothetical protein